MWISQKHYDDLRMEATKCREEARVLADQNRALQNALDWLMQHATQLEKERAALLFRFMDIKIEVPEYAPARPKPRAVDPNLPAMLGNAGLFTDVGDDQAAKMGIGWDPDGTVRQVE